MNARGTQVGSAASLRLARISRINIRAIGYEYLRRRAFAPDKYSAFSARSPACENLPRARGET